MCKGITLLKTTFLVEPELQRCAHIALIAVGGGSRYAPVANAPVAALCQQKKRGILSTLWYIMVYYGT